MLQFIYREGGHSLRTMEIKEILENLKEDKLS